MSNSFREDNYYKLLGVKNDCSPEEIKLSFLKLCKEYHPDKNGNTKASNEKFMVLNEAYTTLSNPQRRKMYDEYISEFRAHRPSDFKQGHYRSWGPGSQKATFRQAAHPKEALMATLFLLLISGSLCTIIFTNLWKNRQLKIDKRNREASITIHEARNNARIYGMEKQLERLKKKRQRSAEVGENEKTAQK